MVDLACPLCGECVGLKVLAEIPRHVPGPILGPQPVRPNGKSLATTGAVRRGKGWKWAKWR